MTRVVIPDIGDFDDVEVIDVLVAVGDVVSAEDPLVTLESDKATMDIPAPCSGAVSALSVKVGDRVSEGTVIMEIEASAAEETEKSEKAKRADKAEKAEEAGKDDGDEARKAAEKPAPAAQPEQPPAPAKQAEQAEQPGEQRRPPPAPERAPAGDHPPHASPGVRRFARELGADLARVSGSGPKGRILREDVKQWVKQALSGARGDAGGGRDAGQAAAGSGIPPLPVIDFSEFGEIETRPLSRIRKLSGPHLQRAWLNVPHVTHNDEADVTDLETFRKSLKAEAEKEGLRVTLLSFVMKAVTGMLKKYPRFNASLAPGGDALILKKYFNVGIAVDTPDGLVVPVIRDVDRKSIFDLARDLAEVSERAREGKLTPADIKGGCISISSLGGIGGTSFTPIINAPEVAILGVSRSRMAPVWDGEAFQPRMMLPLSLSYDHRVIDGAEAARFCADLAASMADARRLSL